MLIFALSNKKNNPIVQKDNGIKYIKFKLFNYFMLPGPAQSE